ncbi:MAG: hypothetical protein II801_05760 [Bacteroidaceae bacterium]|nr:hypothetical protein [Bacteroidaceae bacterium]
MKNESNSYSSFGGEADILHSSFQQGEADILHSSFQQGKAMMGTHDVPSGLD